MKRMVMILKNRKKRRGTFVYRNAGIMEDPLDKLWGQEHGTVTGNRLVHNLLGPLPCLKLYLSIWISSLNLANLTTLDTSTDTETARSEWCIGPLVSGGLPSSRLPAYTTK
ncbi:hypothetical protein H112_00567 [Trichophyton rubrum D6]|uniref:Uncharacterized protein n=3 Tax=Trichophyton TaxID=5550 RepID=F2T043_TRIRC|nr:uncharacterized protein TERG_08181 [Trichophyton rubrum CBS 118892]EZF27468.1 hypothetical protein H100_00566 [Trichophyton rubrum MR850]EZF46498.1 hypothetical protein H102_00566 [Trichophyton rubrum CBS 100081]EZF57156.1 hypothetical protein H103_00566 [Trichophyton rubrum CBS 288.86]EZF67725.1 hypothetical protein H104_00556 [Trichophyton rubrum CBS 289.86]EZF78399.1 hypothetical protein H105_00554 [Trichophyton soudanense CBS 452.61]EZF89095.1 hypothetical protein H110_00570 [Trichophy